MWSLLIIYLLIAIGVSFLCSILEAVLLSITPGFVVAQEAKGSSFGKRLASYKEDIDKPLAAILTLNTFAHTIGAAGVGAQAQGIWGEESLTVVSVVVTILILIGSEIIPKTIGAVAWKRLARPAVAIIHILCLILAPFVWMSQLITKVLRRGGENDGSVLSRADIRVIAEEGYRDGALRKSERAIISNLIAAGDRQVPSIMRPAADAVVLDPDVRVDDIEPGSRAWHRSRLPLIRDGKPVGYVLKDEILARRIAGHNDTRVGRIRRTLTEVSTSATLIELYTTLVEHSEHIAAVVDDDGAFLGLVTMEDLIEAITGLDITDESDGPAAMADRRHRPPIAAE